MPVSQSSVTTRVAPPVDVAHYVDSGGLDEALARHADSAFAELGSARRERVAELAFKRLTELGDDGRLIRRPCSIAELAFVTEVPPGELRSVLEHFSRMGRSFVSVSPDGVVDISHESLIRQWPRLTEWCRQEAEHRDVYLRLNAAVERDAAPLRDPDLSLAREWRTGAQPTQAWADRYDVRLGSTLDFLERSERLERRQRRAKAIGIVTLAVAALAFAGLALWANDQRNAARDAEDISRQQADLAAQTAQDATEAMLEAEALQRSAQSQAAAAEAAAAQAQQLADRASQAQSQAEVAAQDAAQALVDAERASNEERLVAQSQLADAQAEAAQAASVAAEARDEAERLSVEASEALDEADRQRALAAQAAEEVTVLRVRAEAQGEVLQVAEGSGRVDETTRPPTATATPAPRPTSPVLRPVPIAPVAPAPTAEAAPTPSGGCIIDDDGNVACDDPGVGPEPLPALPPAPPSAAIAPTLPAEALFGDATAADSE